MFKIIDKKEIPALRTANSTYSNDVSDFMKSGADAAEIEFSGTYSKAQCVANAYRAAIKKLGADARIATRNTRLFIVRGRV